MTTISQEWKGLHLEKMWVERLQGGKAQIGRVTPTRVYLHFGGVKNDKQGHPVSWDHLYLHYKPAKR